MWIEKFNGTIAIWINELDSYTIQQMSVKPNRKSWSLGQVYQHIIDETSWYHGQIEIALKDVKNADVPITNEAATLFKVGSFADRRIQGDPFISDNVKQPTTIDQIRSDLGKLKINTNKIWGTITKTPSYGKSEHPGIGFLNCLEWLQYSEMHMRHHLKQKLRIESFLNEHNLKANK